MKIHNFIFFIIFLFGCLTSCNNNNPAISSHTQTEKIISTNDTNKIDDTKQQKLSSILYELAISQDPEYFAKKHHIVLDKNRVRVFIFFESSAPDPERQNVLNDYGIMIEKGSVDMIRGLVPLDHLIPLSEEPLIRSIRLPDRLIKTRNIRP